MITEAHRPCGVPEPFDPALHGGGLTEEQRAECVITYDETSYGFVRMAAEALRDAGMIPTDETTVAAAAADEPTTAADEASKVAVAGEHTPATPPCVDVGDPKEASSSRGVPSLREHLLLERLHLTASVGALQAIGPKNNPFLTPLQNTLRKSTHFQSALHEFVKYEVCPALGVCRVAYQRRPTFRVHLAGGPPQGVPHADGLAPYNHQPGEVNIWVPLTTVGGSNSLVSESFPGLGDFHPFEASPGQFVKFYGNRCWHYTVQNTTEITRVSFDIRVVPFELFDNEARGPSKTNISGVTAGKMSGGGKPLRLGEYYVECSMDDN